VNVASGVSVAPDGTVVVSDIALSRVSVFAADGRFLRSFGKNVSSGGGEGAEICVSDCQAGESGTGAGELNSPWGVAAGAGELYVTELNNSRVSVFNYAGQFLRAFGADVGGAGVNVCTATCEAGTGGIGSGQMAGPAGITLDAAGRAHIGELGTNRIDVFDPATGLFQFAFGKGVGGVGVNVCTATCAAGVADGTPGSISLPYSLDVAPSGEVFVAENGGGRVSVFAAGGGFSRQFGAAGEAAGQLAAPYGVAVDGAGNLYVNDTGNNRLAVFAVDGFRGYGRDVLPGAPAGAEICTAICQAGEPGSGIGEFQTNYGLATDCRDVLYVAMVGRIEKWGEPGARVPPCPSNAFTIGKVRKNRKKGTLTVDVTVPGPGQLAGSTTKRLSAKVPQPVVAGTLRVRVKAARKSAKTLRKKGKLRGRLTLTFTPSNGDPNTRSKRLRLDKKVKRKKKKGRRGQGKSGAGRTGR
jgi:hypothetical protein